jgi:hypothetical protein
MCAGLRDAVNLGWKLDFVLAGRAGPDLLASYEEERRPEVSAAVDFSIELGKVICVPDPAEAAARDQAMAGAYDGTLGEAPSLPGIAGGLIADGSPHAGDLFPQGNLGGRWFDDIHGVGWRMVTVDGDVTELDPALVDWLSAIGGPIVDVAGAADELVAWFDTHGVRWALQRPDFHLFGTAVDAAGATHLLAELRRRLAPSGGVSGTGSSG